MTAKCTFEDRFYTPIDPQADSDQLAEQGDRLMLYHLPWGNPKLFVAKQHELSGGWVIGMMVMY